jgi:hypothetical protein
MGENTYRHALGAPGVGEAAPAATYWRRRLVVLTVGLTTLAAAAWSLSESLKVHAGTSGMGSASGPANGGALSRSGHSPGSAPALDPAPSPSATASGFGGFKPPFCSSHSVVLSLSASQAQFGPDQKPNFSLSVVSTQPADCSFNVGVGHLALVIKQGPARIWSSADCVTGSGSLVTALKRGVPTVVSIGWNKKTSSPGCTGPVRSVPAGSYTAYATDGSLVSAPVTVRLT